MARLLAGSAVHFISTLLQHVTIRCLVYSSFRWGGCVWTGVCSICFSIFLFESVMFLAACHPLFIVTASFCIEHDEGSRRVSQRGVTFCVFVRFVTL